MPWIPPLLRSVAALLGAFVVPGSQTLGLLLLQHLTGVHCSIGTG
jgi:hypothetical protein